MAPGRRYRFDRFALDLDDRRLTADGTPVALNGRYFDALALLVSAEGGLVTKDRFLDEVWRGAPVTDEALTQCVRSLRKALGDDATAPRFIETVPKHGYRFVAPVERVSEIAPRPTGPVGGRGRLASAGALAGAAGGGGAGVAGGLIYGLLGAGQAGGAGAASLLLVLVCLTALVGALGGTAVGLGMGAAGFRDGRPGPWTPLGAAVGGMAIGAVVKLIGLDAFQILLGAAPRDITGAPEGFVLGGAVGLGAWLGARFVSQGDAGVARRAAALAGLCGAAAGLAIALAGGRLMGGSLVLLTREFPGARLSLDGLGALVGEPAFGPTTQAVTAALEGGLFAACVAAAVCLTARR